MMSRGRHVAVGALVLALQACGGGSEPPGSAPAQDEPSAPAGPQVSRPAPGSSVFIITPVNGATVSSPVEVKFGISGMEVAPAGNFTENTGHHHLLVDIELVDATLPIPADENHIHFGKGQTETTATLEPGEHTLQLVLGDGSHIPHDPPVVSEQITITVE